MRVLAVSEMIAVVPSRMARSPALICVQQPPVEIQGFTKSMAWHERSHRDAAQQWLRELLHETSQREA